MVLASAGKCSNWGGLSLADDLSHMVCFLSPLFLDLLSSGFQASPEILRNLSLQITLENKMVSALVKELFIKEVHLF